MRTIAKPMFVIIFIAIIILTYLGMDWAFEFIKGLFNYKATGH